MERQRDRRDPALRGHRAARSRSTSARRFPPDSSRRPVATRIRYPSRRRITDASGSRGSGRSNAAGLAAPKSSRSPCRIGSVGAVPVLGPRRSTARIAAAGVAVALWLSIGPGFASTAGPANFSVAATLATFCTVSATNVAFGSGKRRSRGRQHGRPGHADLQQGRHRVARLAQQRLERRRHPEANARSGLRAAS